MEKMLTDCEEKVMAVIWKSGEELDLRQIRKKVNQRFRKEWAPQTISGFLQKMVAKGYLNSYRRGRVFFYTPLISREEYLEEKLTRIAKDFDISEESIETMKHMKDRKKMLTDCEEKVIAVILKSNENLSMEEIRKKVNQQLEEDWAPQTVSTFLQRIVAKGYLNSYRRGRVFFYNPLISSEEYLAEKLIHMAEDFSISKGDIKELL